MIALLLAAAVQTTPVVPQAEARPRIVEPMPNAYHVPARCGSVIEQEVHRQAVAFHGQIPGAQYAVYRRLDGCPVPTPVGYHPSYVEPGAAAKPGDGPANRR